jgi:DNA (cytosine-5)-methyltransferase 1
MNVLDLFSGIGGFSLGLERAGMKTVAFCEIDKRAQLVLKKHWPNVPVFEDVSTLKKEDISEQIDVICGGFPCQDISLAGRGEGLAGKRSGLWFEFHRLINEIKPRYAIIENVSALRSRGLDEVLRSLAKIGYDAEWHCIPASAVGAPHQRDRIWIIAHAGCARGERLVTSADIGKARQGWVCGEKDLLDIATSPFESGNRWPRPLVRRMDDGVPNRVERLKQLGNAVVPQIPEIIGRRLMQIEHQDGTI